MIIINNGLYSSSPTTLFPQYVYDTTSLTADNVAPGLFDGAASVDRSGRRHNVTDHALAAYRGLDSEVDWDDIFFYVYGILHSPDYRMAFAADLKKSLPRIPQVATARDFWAFSKPAEGSPRSTPSTSQ